MPTSSVRAALSCLVLATFCCLLGSYSNADEKPGPANGDAANIEAAKLDAAKVEFFETKIRPVLVERCFQCHSEKAASVKGGLRLDFRKGLMEGGDSGPAIVPGKPDESLLIQALKYDGLEMPPKGKLPDRVIADFESWVRTGATDPRVAKSAAAVAPAIDFAKAGEFWSFQPIKKPVVPDVGSVTGPATDIDAFIAARHKQDGLVASGPADRRVLVRRAYLDLIGIPPTPEQIYEFLKDDSPNAFASLINRLLESPQYGERWGRHWLDVARYGEDQAHTFKARNYPQGFLYRDWVINALNQDMPYDEFLKAQIAGDLLPEPNKHERLAALGIFALGPVYYAENVEKAKAAADEWDDRLDTLTRGVLGLTVACARCHDHKFDPITTQDYYGIAGIFASTNYQERPIASDVVVASRRAADDAVQQAQLDIDRFLMEQGRDLRPNLASEIPNFVVTAWTAINRSRTERNDKKVVKNVAEQAKLSEPLVQRWLDYLSAKSNKSDLETQLLKSWFELLDAEGSKDDLSKSADQLSKVQAIGEDFAKAVTERLPRHAELFKRFGVNVAFVNPADRSVVPAGIIPLGNLFDDSANVELNAAVSTDRFKAVATADSLGVDRVTVGWGTTTKVAPDVEFDFGKLGSGGSAFGSIVNDAWHTEGALRTEGKPLQNASQRAEQGIGMHANALITFDLDEIRRAGLLPPDQKFVLHVDRAGINDDTFGNNQSSCFMAVIVTKPHKDKAVSDAIIAGYVNGQKVDVEVDDFTYYFSGDLPEPIQANGKFFSLSVEVPAEAKHLTLVATGAGMPNDNPISSDHAVFSGVRLEMNPLPSSASEATATSAAESNQQQAASDKEDAILLSRMLYDEGLLALPGNEVEMSLNTDAKSQLAAKRTAQAELKKKVESIQIAMVHSLTEGQAADLPVYLQGNPEKHGVIAPRSMPTILTAGTKSPFKSPGSGRLELAQAIASRDNPLTARVIVNRVWAAHFGTGLVKTTSNFGQLGDRPSHPELLDFLASQFMEQGWSLKQLHRDIMRSAAYQRTSDFNPALGEADPENRLLTRVNRRRLEIEPWRDSMLAVSGELDTTLGGPSSRLTDANNKRRTVYGFVSRHQLDELLRLFDFPDPNITSDSRSVTTVPLQQLFVLNSEFMSQRACALAKRLSALKFDDDTQRIRYAYELIYAREADAAEVELATAYLAGDGTTEDRLSRWEQLALVLLSANEFMFLD